MAVNKSKAIEAAQKLITQGKLKEAAAEYLKVHREDPREQNILNALGDLNVRLKNTPEALNYYGKLAEIYVGDGFLVRGIAMYKKITKLEPANAHAMERLADLYTMQGLMTEARSQYLALAETHLKSNAAPKAMEVMAKVLDLDPDNLKIQQRLADLYERHGQGPEAAHIYRRMADHLLESDQLGESLKWLQKASSLAPDDPEVLMLEARLEQRSGHPDKALAILEKIPNLEAHPEAQRLMLASRLKAGETSGAQELAEQLFSADAGNFAGLLQLAQHSVEQKEGERALGLLKRISQPALDHDPARFLGTARKVSDLLPESAEAADLLLEAARRMGDTHAQLEGLGRRGKIAEKEDDFALAKQVYDELVSLEPENPDFSLKLKEMREKLGEPTVAAEAPEAPEAFADQMEAAPAVEAELDDETHAYINASMTDIDLFSSYGMNEKAIELAQQVLARVPTHIPILERLLDFYLGSSNDAGVVEIADKLKGLYRDVGRNDRAEELAEMSRRYSHKVGKAEQAAPEAPAEAAAEAVHEVDLSAEWATAFDATEAPAEAAEAPAAFNLREATEEVEFYLSQGLTQQAQEVMARYEEQFADEPALAELRARVEAAPPAQAPAESEAPAETEAPAELPSEEVPAAEGQTYEVALEPQPEPAPAAPAAAPMSADKFFADLAGDLDQALAETAASAASPAPPPAGAGSEGAVGALAEVFQEFKEELGEVEEVEDIETHYNLGIAYKEMGLLEEAISEFQKVVKAAEKTNSSSHLFQVCTLLGVCFMDKGLPNIAVRWYERALKSPGIDEEGALALRYDMGVAHEQAGNRQAALDCFMEVYGVNVDYRNVGERIRGLQGSS